jgi:hypothetical protein
MSERAVKQKKAAATASVIVPFSDSDSASSQRCVLISAVCET